MTEHLLRHLYQFGRYLRIRYDSQPNSLTITDDTNKSQDTPAPEKQPTPQPQHQLQQDTHSQPTSENEHQTSEDEQQTSTSTESSETNEIIYIPETQQEIQQETPIRQTPYLPEETPTPNTYETPNFENDEQPFITITKRKKQNTETETKKQNHMITTPYFGGRVRSMKIQFSRSTNTIQMHYTD